jgi:hypothetical protein
VLVIVVRRSTGAPALSVAASTAVPYPVSA